MATIDKYGYRQYLKDKGLTDEQITYDPNSQSVMAKGKFFANAAPEADGSTYDTRANLDMKYKGYMGSTMYDKYANEATQKPAEVKVNPYKPPDMQEIYNNPAYQSGMQLAQRGAQTATNNAMVTLGRRGIGNSQSAVTSANGIQQNAIGNFNAQMIPELTKDHYNKYLDSLNIEKDVRTENANNNKDYLGNVKSVAGDYLGMADADQKRADTDKANRIKYAEGLRTDFGTQVNVTDEYGQMDAQIPSGMKTIKASTEQRQKFQEEVTASDKLGYVTPGLAAILGVEPYSNTLSAEELIADKAYKMGMLGVSNRQAATGERNAATNEMEAATSAANSKRLTDAAANKPTPTPKPDAYKSNQGFSEDFQDIAKSPTQALQAFQSRASEFISVYGYDGLQALVKEAERQIKATKK